MSAYARRRCYLLSLDLHIDCGYGPAGPGMCARRAVALHRDSPILRTRDKGGCNILIATPHDKLSHIHVYACYVSVDSTTAEWNIWSCPPLSDGSIGRFATGAIFIPMNHFHRT